uniref:Uncharacterized protein n=1 Tax=Arundo donax TaxID=35708 RepID=A0A0A9B9L2_ARUDO
MDPSVCPVLSCDL